MADVARSAGVSQKTVSRVVNGEPHVSPAVRRRVLREIERLGFLPNESARALVTRRSRRIGIVTARTSYFGPASVLRDLEHAARAAGYFVSVVHADEQDGDEAARAVAHLVSQGVDAIAVCAPCGPVDPAALVPASLPVLVLRCPEDQGPDAAPQSVERRRITVGNDDIGGAAQATEYLLSLGHRTVHHIAGPLAWASSGHRLRGWRSALRAAGADEPPPAHGDWSPASGYHAARELLGRTGPFAFTALFAANDQMAVGAIHAIERSGRRVPDDISVVGFDDIPEAAYLSVPLSTIRQDFAETARRAIRRLIPAITGEGTPAPDARTPTELVARASTAPPPSTPPRST
ncbi:LacI family transcriptional regulator [Streptomyces radicis]|uniref:LacI family transcriptional regulator n=2 Tax=Streptomyces radicis TaxID=1750517 RepID=A0A3A9WJC6_9ACTN|nr:LacI family transcriptional regulator [Streptomyces radicis]RKN20700.1 LacI family transcriptional regulator [Streptomyces radicis]